MIEPRCNVCKRYPGPQPDGGWVVIYADPTPVERWRCTDCGGGSKLLDIPRNRRPDPTRYTEARQYGGLPPWRKM